MKKKIWETKIPTLLGIAVILVGIALTTFLTKKGVPFISEASLSEIPENIRITNITDSSFTVSYKTADEVLGAISYGQDDKMENTAIDDEDKTTNVKPRAIHTITINNLSPTTNYLFSIISKETTFLDKNKPFRVTTGPVIGKPPSKTLQMRGKIVFPDNVPKDVIVYVAGKDMQMLSAKIKTDGVYSLLLSNARTQDLGSLATFSPNTILTMLIVGNTMQSQVTLFANQIDPVPTIIFSKTYDFTLDTTPVASPSAIVGFPSFSAIPSAKNSVQLVKPKENESFTDQRPTFQGTASPSGEIEIEIQSDQQIKTKVVANSLGLWTYRPQTPLSQGEHTITIKTRDQFGILKTMTQKFTVYAQGTQVGQSATPSATKVPSPTITPTPIPTTVATPTPTPTLNPIPPISPPGTTVLLPLILSTFGIITTGLFLLRIVRLSSS